MFTKAGFYVKIKKLEILRKRLIMTVSVLKFKTILHNFEEEFSKFSERFQLFCKNNNVGAKNLFDLEVSLEEIVLNSFSYGNPNGPVTITVCIQGDEIKVSIHDLALPFNLLREAPQVPEGDLEQRQEGGLGIHLVKNLSDRVEYSASKHGNKITLFKTI